MDTATATKILQNYGAPVTPGNVARVMQEAPHESALLGKSMGLQGGASEEGYDPSILLNKLEMNSRRSAPVEAAEPPIPEGKVTVEQPTVVARAAPTPAAVAPNSGFAGRSGTQGYQPPANTGPLKSGYEVEPDTSAMNPSSNLPDWLIALLGLGATRASVRGTPPIPNAPAQIEAEKRPQLTYEPKLEAPGNKATYPGGAPDNTEGPSNSNPANKISPDNVHATPADTHEPSTSGTPNAETKTPTDPNALVNAQANQAKKAKPPVFTSAEETAHAVEQFRKMFRR